jgi:ketosteroid isomerase-like protein
MTSAESSNLATIRSYLAALESGAVGNELARFFTEDALQVELPNRLNPNGAQSDLPTMLERAARGQHLLQRQTYAVRSEIADGSRVAVEAYWSGALAVPLGSLPAGAVMTAHFAMFFELRDGRIASQRNYDCFETWP